MIKKSYIEKRVEVFDYLCKNIDRNGTFINDQVSEYLKINNFHKRLRDLPNFDNYFPGDTVYEKYLEEAVNLREIIDTSCGIVVEYLKNIGIVGHILTTKDPEGRLVFIQIKQCLS